MKKFKLKTDFSPSGDQPKAISQIISHIEKGIKDQVLLGVTGSGKTFCMAKVIESLNRPALILAPNKTLAGQLYTEFKSFFPENAVEYFVSYYDYYQPEAYVASKNLYIEKDSSINDQLDRMRHSATSSLLTRKDVIIVSSVSCIYGLGSPDMYEKMALEVKVGSNLLRDIFLRKLVQIQYQRNEDDFERGSFRVRGDRVDVFPPYEDKLAYRIEYFGNDIDEIYSFNPLTGQKLQDLNEVCFFPASHYVTSEERLKNSIGKIREELRERIVYFENQRMFDEAKQIKQRTLNDLEMIEEMGFCSGIENYSLYLTGRKKGEAPPTLLEYFPDNFISFIDESHITIPQVGGMYKGDRSRKLSLVEHAFRLPSALDNRPLNFEEFESLLKNSVYVSATPSTYEIEKSKGLVVEQIIRPTGLLDPLIEVKKASTQVEDLLKEIKKQVKNKSRVLVTTLTKKMAEKLTDYYESFNLKIRYLHSDIDAIQRIDILKDLRRGEFDILVGINLLREGLDLPEVGLVAILDADKEGFLRSERSLIQTIGRAARNKDGKVILYADEVTDSMKKAINETNRRRKIQEDYNKKHKIKPQTVKTKIHGGLLEVFGVEDTNMEEVKEIYSFSSEELKKKLLSLKKDKKQAVKDLDFEKAKKIRDEMKKTEAFILSKVKE